MHQVGRPEDRPAGPAARGRVVTQILVAVNLVIFAVGIGAGLQTRDRVIYEGGLVGSGFNPVTQELIGVAAGEWYRIVTGGFLHANLMHVGFNMFILYRLGQLLEPALGRGRFLLVYFVALLGGSFGVLLIDPNHFTVGASGAVFGVMGAAVAVFRARGVEHHGLRSRRHDLPEPGPHVHHPRHLDRRARRRPHHGLRGGRAAHEHRAAVPEGPASSPWHRSCSSGWR